MAMPKSYIAKHKGAIMEKITVNVKVRTNKLYRCLALISAYLNLYKMSEFFSKKYIDSCRFKVGKSEWRKVCE